MAERGNNAAAQIAEGPEITGVLGVPVQLLPGINVSCTSQPFAAVSSLVNTPVVESVVWLSSGCQYNKVKGKKTSSEQLPVPGGHKYFFHDQDFDFAVKFWFRMAIVQNTKQ